MNAIQTRVITCRLIEKMKRNQMFSEGLGLEDISCFQSMIEKRKEITSEMKEEK